MLKSETFWVDNIIHHRLMATPEGEPGESCCEGRFVRAEDGKTILVRADYYPGTKTPRYWPGASFRTPRDSRGYEMRKPMGYRPHQVVWVTEDEMRVACWKWDPATETHVVKTYARKQVTS